MKDFTIFIKEMFEDNPFMSTLLLLSISAVLFFSLDATMSKVEKHGGEIIDKQYKPAYSSSGVGYGFTSSGKQGVVVTSSYENEKFVILVKSGKEIVSVEASAVLYYDKLIGEEFQYKSCKGYFTGLTWSIKALD